MRFVVAVPFSLYLFFALIAFSIGMYVFTFVAIIGSIYLLIRYPREMVGLILLGLAFRFWFITLPIFACLLIFGYFAKKKIENKNTNDLNNEPITGIEGNPNVTSSPESPPNK